MINKLHTLIILFALAIFANAENSYTSTSVLSKGKWVKIRVKNEGVYQLTPSALKGMGFNNPASVRLYGYNRPVLPEVNIQDIEDDLAEIPLYRNASSGSLLFYSKGTTEWKRTGTDNYTHRNNPYSSYIYYFVTEGDEPAKFESKKFDIADSKPTQDFYYAHTLYEEDKWSFLNCGRTFFESYDYANGNQKSYTLDLVSKPMSHVSIKIQFGAAGTSSSTLSVASGNKELGSLSFSKLADYQYASVTSKSFALTDLDSNKLPIRLTHNRATGVTGHLDYIMACYEAELALTDKNYVAFNPYASTDVNISIKTNGKSDIVLWNVTSPSKTWEVTGTNTNGSYSAPVANAKQTDLYVALDKSATYPEPEKVGSVANQNLHALEDINLLIIVPANGKLTAQAQRLADIHKEHDGMKCAVVRADQVYNEFSSGTPDITAYRRLAKMLYDRDNSLQNILLFGACYWDNRFVTSGLASKKQEDYLLVWESINSWSHTESYACEEYIALLDDGEGASPLKQKPDAGVGRLPVTTEAEAKQVVDKLINYINNKEAGGWKNTICMMGDDGNANIHMEDAESVLTYTQSAFPEFRYKRIYWDSYELQQAATGKFYPDALAEINRTMEEGALIMNYTGHGAAYCLSHEQVLKTSNFQNWDSPRLPLWITAGCDICPFDMNTENLACEAVLNPKGGAMGMISTARTVYSSYNRTLNRYFMRRVLGSNDEGERYTIGEALALAKCDIIGNGNISKLDSLNKAQYVLIGDPAIRLQTPTYKVTIDGVDGANDDDDLPTLRAGSLVTVRGHISDSSGKKATNYQGVIYPTVFDTEEKITCHNNDGSADNPFTYTDRPRLLYSGTDSIKAGEFSFTFAVPVDLNYSEGTGMMKLYAVNSSLDTEAHGTYNDFYVGGTGEASTDTIGPSVIAYLNHSGFYNGMHVGKNPTLYVLLSDSCGINTTGNGIGHDIVAIVDGKEASTYSLNSYYTQSVGDYTKGSISYQMEGLEPGEHTLTLRAFDIFNNPGICTISFVVYDGEETAEIFDMSGRSFNSAHTTALPPGVYIRRYTYRNGKEVIEEKTEKFIITQ